MVALYPIALFLHITGALGVFASVALDWVALSGLRRATTVEQAREWLGVYRLLQRVGPLSVALLLVFGLYLAAVAWGATAWIAFGFFGLIAIAALGAFSGVQVGRIAAWATGERGPLPAATRDVLQSRALTLSIRARFALVIAIVLLMTTKPDPLASLAIVAIALALGIGSALVTRPSRTAAVRST
jgi:hypothetical protein